MSVRRDDCAGADARKIPKEGRLQAGFPLDTAAALDSYNALRRTVKIEAGKEEAVQDAGFDHDRINGFRDISNSCHRFSVIP
jgi:hypothetical protein